VQPGYICTLGAENDLVLPSVHGGKKRSLAKGVVPKSIELISARQVQEHALRMRRKTQPRLRTVTIRGKEFQQVSVPQPGGGWRLRTLKNAEDAKKFYAAVQDEISRLALYGLEEEARHYVHGEAAKRIKPKTISTTKLLEAVPRLPDLSPYLFSPGVLGVLGQDAPEPVTYTFGLEHVAIHGRITGIVDGDTIDVLILGKQQPRVRRPRRISTTVQQNPIGEQDLGASRNLPSRGEGQKYLNC
jgi:hypothetical protein